MTLGQATTVGGRMLWTPDETYQEEPFQKEADLESAIKTVSPALFGQDRIYLDVKKLIGTNVKNVPDAYLVDLTSNKQPILWVVENELASHDPLRHIAVQILQMSLSFKATPQKVKRVVKGSLEQFAMDLVHVSAWVDGCLFGRSKTEDSPGRSGAAHEPERGCSCLLC